jgi:RNA polymerase sigma factor (sigma-70 family)
MPDEDAADVFQIVWLDLHSELEKLREPAALRGWLVSVTSHKCLRWKERESKRAGVALGWETADEPTDSRPLPGEVESQAEQDQVVRDAVESIPERCRKMIRMLFYEQPPRPYLDVAKELGLAEGSIGFIRGRCLDKLKKALDKCRFSR